MKELKRIVRTAKSTMEIDIKSAAKMIGTPEGTLRRWASQGKIPARERSGMYVFRKNELARWARRRNMTIMDSPAPAVPKVVGVSLYESMKRGGVFFAVPGGKAGEVLEAACSMVSVPETVDRKTLLERLLQREALASTGIGQGVAIPHPRYPLETISAGGMIATCFLEEAVNFNAVDGLPVFVVFIIFSPDTKTHLKLLSRLSFCLRDDGFIQILRGCENGDDLLGRIRDMEQAMALNEKGDGV